MKTKNKIIIAIFVILIISTLMSTSYAVVSNNSQETFENSTIESVPVTVTLKDSIKRSKLNSIYQQLGSSYPSKYSLEDMQVRNQKKANTCWAYVATALISSNIQKINNTSAFTLFSPRHIEYKTAINAFSDTTNSDAYSRNLNAGANHYIGLAYATAGYGPILEEEMPETGVLSTQIVSSSMPTVKPTINIDDYIGIPNLYKARENDTITYKDAEENLYTQEEVTAIRELIKSQIQKNGAIGAYLAIPDNKPEYFNSTNTAFYCNDYTAEETHNVTIVGWDDDYEISNFSSSSKPVNKGAYKVMNSWGTSWGDSGYFYVSYDDPQIETALFGVEKTSNVDYDNIYQYDQLGFDAGISTKIGDGLNTSEQMANVFTTKTNNTNKIEYLNKVSVYVPETSTVTIYANGADENKNNLKQVAVTQEPLEVGYHIIELSSPVKITGSKFVVAAKYYNEEGVQIPLEYNYKTNQDNAKPNMWDTASASEGESYIYFSSVSEWKDLVTEVKGYTNSNVCLKAFTSYSEEKTIPVTQVSLDKSTLSIEKGSSLSLVATILPIDATNKEVTWKSSDTNIATVSNTGIITAVKEGTVTITVTTLDGSKTGTCQVTVTTKTSSDDDIYKEDTNGTSNTSSNQSSGTSNTSSSQSTTGTTTTAKIVNGQTSTNTQSDSTTAKTNLPKSGTSTIIIIAIIIIFGIGIYTFIRIHKYNDVK